MNRAQQIDFLRQSLPRRDRFYFNAVSDLTRRFDCISRLQKDRKLYVDERSIHKLEIMNEESQCLNEIWRKYLKDSFFYVAFTFRSIDVRDTR